MDYTEHVLPLLKKYGMVHLFGYGNRLGFDPLPFDVQVQVYTRGCIIRVFNLVLGSDMC